MLKNTCEAIYNLCSENEFGITDSGRPNSVNTKYGKTDSGKT